MLEIKWSSASILLVICACVLSRRVFDYNTRRELKSLPTPDHLVTQLSEEEFEDYLDYWLHQKWLNRIHIQERFISSQDSCVIPVQNLKEPSPVFASEGSLLHPDGTSGNIVLKPLQRVEASCPGDNNGLVHKTSTDNPPYFTFTCQEGSTMLSSWINEFDFQDVLCLHRTTYTTVKSKFTCSNRGTKIDSKLAVGSEEYIVFMSCFDHRKYEVLYVEYELGPENVYFQPSVGRPNFNQGTHYPNLKVDRLYKQKSQRNAIDYILGPSMGSRYINSTYFFSRGHLAAKTDFILAAEQRATFTFVNTAPQWQIFNGGNWNTLEQSLRTRISEGDHRMKIFSGTWDILKLPDFDEDLKEIYLSPQTKQLPVPLWYYKVVYDPINERGVVFLGLNNPYVTLAEAEELAFCTDVCHENPEFSWLRWKPTDMRRGYSICCEIDDFRETVPDLPPFTTKEIFS